MHGTVSHRAPHAHHTRGIIHSLHRCDKKGERYLSTIRGYPYIRPVRAPLYDLCVISTQKSGEAEESEDSLNREINCIDTRPLRSHFYHSIESFDTVVSAFAWLIRILFILFSTDPINRMYRWMYAKLLSIILVDLFDRICLMYIYIR